jgi:DNA (cytosine-5)-methyltransferase 1
MRYLSLFTGIGGFELGIRQAYPDWECVGYSEIDPHALSVYQQHFPNHYNYGDITAIDPDALPDFDLLCGGFPCQAFSIAGRRRGFNDTRGTLFFEIERILRRKKCRYLLLENVKGLLSHDGGRTFHTIISTLDELGYDLQWQVLNSKDFGVPQNRERVFIVGHLRGEPRPEVFPLEGVHTQDIGLLENTATQLNSSKRFGNSISNHHFFTLRATEPNGVIVRRVPLNFLTRNQKKIEGDYAFTVDSMNSGGVMISDRGMVAVRKLTPLECERLQGFPDDWTEGISQTQRYKCLGNGVTVNVVKAIISRFNSIL